MKFYFYFGRQVKDRIKRVTINTYCFVVYEDAIFKLSVLSYSMFSNNYIQISCTY